ncbi:MAG: hypothetical protein QM831_45075 [Kofleriaceae bacterium]
MRALPALCTLAACSQDPAHVQLAPLDYGNGCGKVSSVSAIRVTAYAPSGDVRRTDATITDFPADTTQLGVELLVGSEVTVAGKSAPLGFNDLAEGTQIPIAMAPLEGFCQLPGMAIKRSHPLVARAGAGVLIFGGDQPDPDSGATGVTAEYYDPATARFIQVDLPDGITERVFTNGTIASLTDGRAVITGDNALLTFNGADHTFYDPSFIAERAKSASFGLDASHVLVTGGCALGGAADCEGMDAMPLHSSYIYEIDDQGKKKGDPAPAPSLLAFDAFGGTLFDIGTISDGSRRLTLARTFDDPTSANQIPIPDGATTAATGMHAQVAQLDGGALLNAFDPDGMTSGDTSPAGILPPENSNNIEVAHPATLSGARLVGLEDGTAIALGATDVATGGEVLARYIPTTNTWDVRDAIDVMNFPAGNPAPETIRLADGSVLVLPGDVPSTNAWLYRPSLMGPNEGNSVSAQPDASGNVLTTPWPETVTREGRTSLTLHGDDGLTARALVGGPRRVYGTLLASVNVASGGVALIARQSAPARLLAAILVPGEPARIERHDGAQTTTLCTGSTVSTDLSGALMLSVASDSITASVGATALVSCNTSADPIAPEAGSWGIASTANGSLGIVTITVGK